MLGGVLVLLFVLAIAAGSQAQISNFQHIVIIVQENRTPDTLFQGLCGPNRSLCPAPYDLQNFGIDNKGKKIPLIATPLGSLTDPKHGFPNFLSMCNLDPSTNQCRMNGTSSEECKPVANDECPFEYVNPGDVAPYITMAQQYGWANYMFQTNQGPSTPAHQILFSGTAARSAQEDSAAAFIISLNPQQGCLTPLNAPYLLVSPQTWPNWALFKNSPLGSTCFSHDSVPTLLDQHNPPLSWKYYTPSVNFFWTAPNWLRDLCQPNAGYTKCTGKEFANDVDVNPSDVLTDIGNCQLRNVLWVIPTWPNSDHGGFAGGATGGPSWVSSIVNAVGQSPCVDSVNNQVYTYWQDTAIFVTWDDWGGFYDHEAPTLLSVPTEGQGDNQYGFRVPLVVVSAYTPAGFVSNNRSDFGSLLRFTEQNFGIPEGALNFADARATTDLTEFFNLNSAPRTFTPIQAPLKKEFFLHDKRPLEAPDND